MKKLKILMSLFLSIIIIFSVLTVAPITANASGNNTVRTAKLISVNKFYTDNISTLNDIDYYKFTINMPSKININFSHEMDDSSSEWGVVLYDTNNNTLVSFYPRGSETSCTSCNIGISSGTYYIKIYYTNSFYASFSNIDFRFKVNCTATDCYETEVNDSFATSDKININITYSGSLKSSHDMDYYKFTINNSSKINIKFSHDMDDNSSEWGVILYDTNNNSLVSFYPRGSEISCKSYDLNLSSGTYYIKIYYTNSFYSSFSDIDYSFAVNKVIPTPYLNTATNTNSGVKLSWYTVSGVDGYYVYRKSGSSSWKKIGTVNGSSKSSYTDKTVSSGTTYTYTVRAYSGSTLSGYQSYGVSVKYLKTPSLKYASNTVNGAKVYWNKVSGAQGYYVYRKTGSSNWKKIATVGSGADSYIDKTSKSGTTYTYTVRAYSGSTRSAYITSGVSVKYLTAPKISSATSTKSGIAVKWSKTTGASGYYVYRKTSSSGWKKIGTVGSSNTSYTDKTAKKGTTYTYTIRAYSGSTRSSYYNSGKKCKDIY